MLNKAFYSILLRSTFQIVIVCIGVSPPPPPPPSFLPSSPLLNLQTVQVPFLRNPPSILLFHETSLKVEFFSEPWKYQNVSSLTPSYLLKVTKLLVEFSEFEFSVMTEKKIFAHKLLLPLNIQILIF